jgi:hypothetical protein
MHEVEHVDLVHHIHEFNDMIEIKETIKILKNLVPLFNFCELYVCKENGQKGVNKIPNHNITCKFFIPMDDKCIERIS